MFYFFKNSRRGEIATILTVLSVLLMTVGVGVGTFITQKQTRTTSRAATGTCADSPWRPNGGTLDSDYSACGSRFGSQYAVGNCGFNSTVNKWFLCKVNPSNPLIPNDENWYGPCDTEAQCNAAKAVYFPSPTDTSAPTTTTQPSVTPAPTINQSCYANPGSCSPTPAPPTVTPNPLCVVQLCSPTPAPSATSTPTPTASSQSSPSPIPSPTPVLSKLHADLKYVFNLSDKSNSISKANTSYIVAKFINMTNQVAAAGVATQIGKYIVQGSTNNTQVIDIYSAGHTVYELFNVFSIDEVTSAKVHVFSRNSFSDGPAESIPLCQNKSAKIDAELPLNQSDIRRVFHSVLDTSYYVPIVFTFDCDGKEVVTAKVGTQQYTKQDVQNKVKEYVDGTLSPEEMSAFLVDYQKGLGLQIQFCDPLSGGCTPKFN